jgi:hypothetical protein
MNKYGLSDQGQTWDQAVKIANRYCRDSDSETTKRASAKNPSD